MKVNAIVRIVLFSIIIVLLTGILVFAKPLVAFFKSMGEDFGGPKANLSVVDPFASQDGKSIAAVYTGIVDELRIEWAAGSITILPITDADTIRFWDDYTGDEEYMLHFDIEGDKLVLQFCDEDWVIPSFGIGLENVPNKNLTVQIPASWLCEKLEIESASAKIELHDLNLNNVELDVASGAIGFENCNVMHLDVDTASGDLIYSGTLMTLDCDSASATVVANLQNVPQSMDLDTASGNLDITLPEDAGFSVKLDAINGKFQSDFDFEKHNNRYVCGNGGCTIDVSAMSGNVHIRKNAGTAHQRHTDACTNDPNCPDYHHKEDHH